MTRYPLARIRATVASRSALALFAAVVFLSFIIRQWLEQHVNPVLALVCTPATVQPQSRRRPGKTSAS
jgi:hypothetical protein